MPGSFETAVQKLQDLKKANQSGVNNEQYMDTLLELIEASEVVRYYNSDDELFFIPPWKTMKSPQAIKKNILDKADDVEGISIFCKKELDGDPYVITIDENGYLTDISDGPVPAEETMRHFKGLEEPKKPSFGDYLHHWFKDSFFATLFWKEDREDAVEAYEQYEKNKAAFKTNSGYIPGYEIDEKKKAEENAARAYEEQLNANDVEPDLSVKGSLSTEVTASVQADALNAKPVCRMLTPSKLGYKATEKEETVMLANMPDLDKFARPEHLSDPRLADDWQAYSEFTSKIIDAGKNNIKIIGLVDTMSQNGTLKELYGAYKTNFFNNRTIDLESALGEAVEQVGSKNGVTVDINAHMLKGSTYNPQMTAKPVTANPVAPGGR